VQLEHSFSVPVPVDEAWKILLDIERIGPCLPGAVIDSVDGDDFTGTVKVKLGPINLSYKGKASFVEKDEAARRAVIDARGRDARGNGTANAKITASLQAAGSGTTVQVNTDLEITGKPAQFGRGVMVDVGNKLLGQFADALAATITAGDAAEPAADAAAATDAPAGEPAKKATAPAKRTTPRTSRAAKAEPEPAEPEPQAEATSAASVNGGKPSGMSRRAADVEPIDLLKHAGPAVGKRLAGPVAVALVIALIAARRRRRG
jgi:carbon monoxide dehydrogenase subunit G